MVSSGDVIENPKTGETMRFIRTSGETDEDGMPDPLQLAVMMEKYDHVIRPASPPTWLH